VGLALVIVAVFGVGVVAAVTKAVDAGPDHPDAWDPRVEALAAFVEEARELDFDHPVHVDFLTPAEYSEAATTGDEGVDEDDRTDLDRFAGELRAMGVASGDLDLFAVYDQVVDAGTLAFYDPVDQRVRVRGTAMTVGLEVTIVHELTHALQDQHFEVERLYDDDLDSSASTALRGLIEGDATRIEEAYTSSELTPAEQAEYDEEYAGELETSEAGTSDVPDFVSATFAAPYLLGQPLVVMLANQGGNGALDDAFRDPPTTEEHLFDPASFLADEGGEELDLDLDDDLEAFDEGPFGSPAWYLVLAERIDPKVALDATLGWAGDRYAAYEQNGRTCITAAFAGDTPDDEEAMAAALDAWAAGVPGGLASSTDIGGHPGFVACDPGADVDLELTGRSERSLFLPSLWGYLVADAATVLDADGARCYARRVVDAVAYEDVNDLEGTAFAGDDFQRALVAAYDACA
jgi:hypothetical protein